MVKFQLLTKTAWAFFLCAVGCLVSPGGTNAAITWEKGYKIPNGQLIEQATDGGYLVANFTVSKPDGQYTPGVMKLNSTGDVLWHRGYPSDAGNPTLSALKPTRDGGVILCGKKAEATYSAWVMKLDGSGNVLWSKTYHLAVPTKYNEFFFRNNEGIDILETTDGGFALLSKDIINTVWVAKERNLWLLKLKVDGEISWQKLYSNSSSDWPVNLAQTADGGFMVTAHTDLGSTLTKPLALRLDSSGNIEWAKTYSGGRNDMVHSLLDLGEGGFALAGTSPMPYPVWEYPWVLRIDAAGNILWQKEYSTDEVRYPVMLLPSADNGFLLAGSETGQHPFLLGLDHEGTAQWSANLGRGVFRSFRQTTDGGYIIARPYGDYAVSKLDGNAEGCLPYNRSYLTATVENDFVAADANVTVSTTDCIPTPEAAVSHESLLAEPRVSCLSALPQIAVDSSAVDYGFGAVAVKTTAVARVYVSNLGEADLDISGVTVTGSLEGDFSLSSDCGTLFPGGFCTAEIVFVPLTLGHKSAVLTVVSNDPERPKIEVLLSGEGVDIEPPVLLLNGEAEVTVEAGTPYLDAGATAADNYDGDLIVAIVTGNPVNTSVVGTYKVTYDVADSSGNRAVQLIRTVQVVDTIAPEVTLSTDKDLLWPPNHKMVDVLVDGGARDGGAGLASVLLTLVDEYGEYDMTLADFGSPVALEAWRDGKDKDGRVYTLTVVATDQAGNSTTRSVEVIVPHDMRK